MQSKDSEEGWWQFLTAFASINDAETLNAFMHLFLTMEERTSVADRYRIIRELVKGEKTQRQIAADLNVSIAKITRGSNSLKIIDESLKTLLVKQIG